MSKSNYSKRAISFIRQLLSKSAVEAFKDEKKYATGKTIRSVETDMELDGWTIDATTKAGAGAKYIIEGKPAGTKLPVEKFGTEWRLKPNLQEWKEAVGNQMNYWILAKTIADNPREGIDIPEMALEIYKKHYATPIENMIANEFTQAQIDDLRNRLKEIYK